MKIVVVGDALVSADTLEEAAKELNIGGQAEIKKYDWYSNLEKEQFQEKILQIEKGGPEKVEIPNGILDDMKDADYLLVHIAPVSKAMIEASQQLKLIGTCRGGLEHLALDAIKEKGIKLIHVIRNAEPVADFTIGLMYAETRNIARAHLAIKQGEWRKDFSNNEYKTTLSNHVVGLLGVGYIGKLVAQRLNGLRVKTIAYDPYVDKEALKKEGIEIEFVELEELFQQSNLISLHMRVTPETTNMVNKSLISLMKPDSYIINTARATVLDKDDLVEALQKKQIAGAALDVSWVEPIVVGDPLLDLDNITLTTHIAGDTIDAIPRSPYLLRDVLNAYFEHGFSDMEIKL